VLLGLATAAAVAIWGLVWVMWTIRPMLAAAGALAAAFVTLNAVRRQRSNDEWQSEEWLGS
jgi:hypothetical protein